MVRQVRAGNSMRSVATEWGVSVGKVAFWVQRAEGRRLDRADFSDRAPGCSVAWNRLDPRVEQRVLQLRQELRDSILGEYGAEAIQQALEIETGAHAASRPASIGCLLATGYKMGYAARVALRPRAGGIYRRWLLGNASSIASI